jgi:hypothetical protein
MLLTLLQLFTPLLSSQTFETAENRDVESETISGDGGLARNHRLVTEAIGSGGRRHARCFRAVRTVS